MSQAQISMTVAAWSPAKADLCGQGYVSEPRLDVTVLVQADLKSPALPGKQGGQCHVMNMRALLVLAACRHSQQSHLHSPHQPLCWGVWVPTVSKIQTTNDSLPVPCFQVRRWNSWHIWEDFQGKPKQTKYLLPVVSKGKKTPKNKTMIFLTVWIFLDSSVSLMSIAIFFF